METRKLNSSKQVTEENNSIKPQNKKNLFLMAKKSTRLVSNSLDLHLFDKRDDEDVFSLLLSSLKKQPNDRDPNDITIIKNFLSGTELMNKFKLNKEITENSFQKMLTVCASYLGLVSLADEQDLFKIDDIGDKFFIILKGSVSVMKPIDSGKIKMTLQQYMEMLIDHYFNNEKYIVNKYLKENPGLIYLQDFKDFPGFIRFLVKYMFHAQKEVIKQISEIEDILKKYKLTFASFSITKEELKEVELMMDIESIIDFFKEKFKFTQEEENSICFRYLLNVSKDKSEKEVNSITYQKLIKLQAGKYFGDFALDNKNKKRTATIRASGECYLGYVTNKIYEKYIQAEANQIKNREMSFIVDNFFFDIQLKELENKYYQHFTLHEYNKGYCLFKEGYASDRVILVKEGLVEVNYNGTLVDLTSIMKNLINRLMGFKLTSNFIDISELKEYSDLLKDETVEKLKYKPENLIKSLNKNLKIQISLISAKDLCGLEEIFLADSNRIFSAYIHSINAKVYKIQKEKIVKIINSENQCIAPYYKLCVAKIYSLIKRLLSIRNTIMDKITNNLKDEEKIYIKKQTVPNVEDKGIKINKAMIKVYEKSNSQKNIFDKRYSFCNINPNLDNKIVLKEKTSFIKNSKLKISVTKLDSGTNLINPTNKLDSTAGNKNDLEATFQNLSNFKVSPYKSFILNESSTNSPAKLLKMDSSFEINSMHHQRGTSVDTTMQIANQDNSYSISPIKLLKCIKSENNSPIKLMKENYVSKISQFEYMSTNMKHPNKDSVDVEDSRSVLVSRENRYRNERRESKLIPFSQNSSQRQTLLKQSPGQEPFLNKKEKLYHDNVVLNKIKTNLAEFQNRSIVSKMIRLNSRNQPISIRLNQNISSILDNRDLKSSNIMQEYNKEIYKIKIKDDRLDSNFFENERKFNIENSTLLPEINNNKFKKKESSLIDDKLIFNEEVDLTKGIQIKNIDQISNSKKTVKLVKKFYKESKLNGYRNFISSNNSLIKRQKSKKILDKRDTVSFSNDSLKFIVGFK